jgi:hypothetical protein
MRTYLVMGYVVLVMTGCAHSVNYKLTEQDRWRGARLDKVVRVQTFQDQSTPVTAATFKDGAYLYRTNYRAKYANKQIADGVTAMVIKHLQHAGIFRNVVPASSSVPADYELTATITQYYAQGRVNTDAETTAMIAGSGGGLLGALLSEGLTAGDKTEIQANVEFRPVTLTAIGDGTTVWSDTVNVATNFTASWRAASEPVIFQHADNCLKDAVAELIRRLASVLEK